MMNVSRIRGFTLLELLVTVTIVVTLVTAIAPNFYQVIVNTQIKASTDSLIRANFLARAESIKRGQRVIICLSGKGKACNSASPSKVIIFVDSDRSGSPTSPSDMIRSFNQEDPAITISYNRPFLAYEPTGYAAGTNGTFTICHSSGSGGMVVISSLGRPRKAIDYDGDGIVEKYPGKPLKC